MFAEVIVDILNSNVDKIFDYTIEPNNNFCVGQRVLVPFASRIVEGYILKIKDTSNYDSSKLKSIIKSLDDFCYLNEENITLINFLMKTYNLRYCDCIRLFVPTSVRKNVKEKFIKYVTINTELNLQNIKLNENQAKIVEFVHFNSVPVNLLKEKFSLSSIKTLIKNKVLIESLQKENRTPYNFNNIKKTNIKLTLDQQKAVDTILNNNNNNNNNKFLLFGVTASGKTEVYIKVIESVLKENKSAILLVPEIGLTPQLFKRFTSVFGENIAIIHSGLSDGEKLDEWLKIKRGEAKVVIGARSAIFAPIDNLGAVIIDEEHDGSYYSENNPRYNAIEVAAERCKFFNAKLILGSATPSVESYFKAQNNEYTLIEMKKRAVAKKLPEIYIVDMLSELRLGNSSMFSKLLQMKLKNTIDKKEQALIFLNRRGYTSFLKCLDCGYVPKCEDCDVSLVYHKEDEKLKCHYCGNRYKVLTKCPVCGSVNIRKGAIGTEQVVEKLESLFPNVKIFRMDNDTTSTKNAHVKIIEEFNKTKPAILVGTQMIAKGHNFNSVSLVGIIDADLSLHYADFRSTERTFDLLTQVSGRAGRTELDGEVVLQTYIPRHFAYNCVQQNNYEKFYAKEINLRSVTHFPPFSKIVRILSCSENEDEVQDFIKQFYEKVVEIKNNNPNAFIYLGAMKSPVKRAKRQFRYQILMRLNTNLSQDIISQLFEINKTLLNKNVLSFVEIDPQNLS